MQPTQSNMLCRTSSGTTPLTTTSDTAKRPPGLRTRKASRRTRDLSAERLMTQLEMTTSTDSFWQRNVLYLTLKKLNIVSPCLSLIFSCEGEHVIRHVETIGLTSRPHSLRR